jgi:putative DNA primase/helicase
VATTQSKTHDKPLPHSPEAERALLGGILLGGDGPWLDASDFFLPFHQSLSQALNRLRAEGKPTNDLVLVNELLSPAELEQCGGIAYIASLVDGIPRISNLAQYARIIREHALARGALAALDLMSRKLATANGNVPEVLREVSAFSASLAANLREGGSPASHALRAVSVTELLRLDVKAREMVLHPFLPTQGLAMLYSTRGVGKTFISLGISVAVAGGTKFLKWAAPKPRRVLYVDGEMPCAALQKRIADIIAGSDVAHPLDDLRLITPDLQDRGLPDLATADGQKLIEAHLDGVGLLVLDNLSSLVRAVKENEGEGWLPVQDWALDLRRRGISVLFVHHAGKAGAQRGTSRREDLLDSVVTLKHPNDYSPSEGLRCDVHYEKSRGFYGEDARPFEVKLMEGPSGEAVWTVGDPETSIEARILEMHRQGMSLRDIAEEAGSSKSKVHRIIRGMESRLSQCPKDGV